MLHGGHSPCFIAGGAPPIFREMPTLRPLIADL